MECLTCNQILLLIHIHVGTKYKTGTFTDDLKRLISSKLLTNKGKITAKGIRLIENIQNLLKYNELGLIL